MIGDDDGEPFFSVLFVYEPFETIKQIWKEQYVSK